MHYEFDINLQPQAEGPCSRPRWAVLCRQCLAPAWVLVSVCCFARNHCSSLLVAWLEWPPLLKIWSTQLCGPKHLGELKWYPRLRAQMCKKGPETFGRTITLNEHSVIIYLCRFKPVWLTFVEHGKRTFWFNPYNVHFYCNFNCKKMANSKFSNAVRIYGEKL